MIESSPQNQNGGHIYKQKNNIQNNFNFSVVEITKKGSFRNMLPMPSQCLREINTILCFFKIGSILFSVIFGVNNIDVKISSLILHYLKQHISIIHCHGNNLRKCACVIKVGVKLLTLRTPNMANCYSFVCTFKYCFLFYAFNVLYFLLKHFK